MWKISAEGLKRGFHSDGLGTGIEKEGAEMVLLANFLIAVSRIVHIVLMVYVWVVILRAVFSWINVPSLYQVYVLLFKLTEPVLKPIRKRVPPHRFGGLDISPIIVILLIMFIDTFLVKSLMLYARSLLRRETLYLLP